MLAAAVIVAGETHHCKIYYKDYPMTGQKPLLSNLHQSEYYTAFSVTCYNVFCDYG